ncbi:MAG: hypothetical protein K2P77_08840 [Burkholderiaceae bacterium]|nr:hypothetical protein [Burkholderiaceae bacterium]
MEAWVSVPIESRQIQRLIDQLGLRGGAPDLQQALADAIELWLVEQRKLQVGGAPCSVHGYQWKTVFLPDGTLLRTVSYHDEQCARVQGNEIIFNGRVVTPNQLAHWAGRGTRNAWNDIYVRRPQDKFYIHASRLRMLVQQEQAQAQEIPRPACDAAAVTSVATPASNLLSDLVNACAAVLQRTLLPMAASAHGSSEPTVFAAASPASRAAEPAPREGGKGEGWELPERRKFRFRLEDVAFS